MNIYEAINDELHRLDALISSTASVTIRDKSLEQRRALQAALINALGPEPVSFVPLEQVLTQPAKPTLGGGLMRYGVGFAKEKKND